MSFVHATLVPEAMHVVGKVTITFDLQFGQTMRLSICFFNGSLSSRRRVDGGNDRGSPPLG